MTPENTLLFAASSQHRLPLRVFGSNGSDLKKKKKKCFLYRKASTGLVDQTLHILQINLFSSQPLASFWDMSSEPWNILLYDSHFVCLRLRSQFTSLILYVNSGVLCEYLALL